jgi:aminoglycoside phosphotransferase (APT) family kinase protein
LGGVEVESASAERIVGAGNGSRLYRVSVRYAVHAAGPSTLILKLPTDNVVLDRVFNSALAMREVRFYRDFARDGDLPVPRVYFAEHDVARGCASILMEDIDGVRPVDEPTIPDTEAALMALARLQARFWRSPLLDVPWLDGVAQADLDVDGLVRNAIAVAQRLGFGDAHITRSVRIMSPVAELARAQPPLSTQAQSLCHGDFHRNNIHLYADGRAVIFDWQVVDRGNPLRDVSYWMILSLTTSLRRAHHKRLLRLYYDALTAAGVRDYGWRAARRDYRAGVYENLMKLFAAVAAIDADDTTKRRMLERFDAAARDHHLLAVAFLTRVLLPLRGWWLERVARRRAVNAP